jgi:hypothetical protein
MRHYLGVARENGITDDEIGAVQSIVMAVSAGRVEAQFREARERGALRPAVRSCSRSTGTVAVSILFPSKLSI